MKFLSLNKVASAALAGLALFVFQAVAVQKAWAHYPIITATATCSNGAPVINYTVTSWDPGQPDGTNPNIEVLFNLNVVGSGPLTSPNWSFSGSAAPPPNTDTVDVQAVAAAAWGDNYPAGNYSFPTITLTIPSDCAPGIGRFTGGGKQVTVDGVAVTKGFEVDCDLHQPSNNLEINWQSGGKAHQFHMLAFTEAICSWTGSPLPPKAPVNTINGTGTGRYDGTDGYTVIFELVDNGEPGSNDEAAFVVYPNGDPLHPVLNVPLEFITGGNIQAHVDQK